MKQIILLIPFVLGSWAFAETEPGHRISADTPGTYKFVQSKSMTNYLKDSDVSVTRHHSGSLIVTIFNWELEAIENQGCYIIEARDRRDYESNPDGEAPYNIEKIWGELCAVEVHGHIYPVLTFKLAVLSHPYNPDWQQAGAQLTEEVFVFDRVLK